MPETITTSTVAVTTVVSDTERLALEGFLAGYSGRTRSADIEALALERGHRTLTVLRKGGKVTSGYSQSQPTRRGRGLYRLVDAAYEKRSLAISSNLHPSGFDEIMPKTIAGATVDPRPTRS